MSATGFLHAHAGELHDGDGNPIVIRGVGLGNWMLPEGYMWRFDPPGPQSPRKIEAFIRDLVGHDRAERFWVRFRAEFVTERDVEKMAAEGFDHIRLPLNARLLIADDGSLIDAGFEMIDRLLRSSRTHGLLVVLDLHGAPGGQTGTNIDDSPNEVPELFASSQYRQLTIRLWRAIAERYRDDPTVAGYDLLNEPLPDEYQVTYRDDLVALYRELTAAIREIDTNHLIIYEGMHWATNWSIFDEVWDVNSMLQFHKYWSPPDLESIQQFIDTGNRLGLPIYMGEGGENNNDWIQTAFQLYDDHRISWNFWTWKKIDTVTSPCSVVAPPGWDALRGYARGDGDRPDADDAWATLTALLDAFAVDRCAWRTDVVAAMFHRPPLRLPASGFGFRGPGVSYHTSSANPLDSFRGTDAVTLKASSDIGGAARFDHTKGQPRTIDEQILLELDADDWVSYCVATKQSGPIRIEVELVRLPNGGATSLEVTIDGSRVTLVNATSTSVVGTTDVEAGAHDIRIICRGSPILVRWISVGSAQDA